MSCFHLVVDGVEINIHIDDLAAARRMAKAARDRGRVVSILDTNTGLMVEEDHAEHRRTSSAGTK